MPRVAVEVRPEQTHRQQQRVALQWHALEVSLDAVAVLFGDGHLAAAGLLAGRAMRVVEFPAHLRSGQLRDGADGAGVALCSCLRRGVLDTAALGYECRPGSVTVYEGASVSHDRAEERRVMGAYVRQ